MASPAIRLLRASKQHLISLQRCIGNRKPWHHIVRNLSGYGAGDHYSGAGVVHPFNEISSLPFSDHRFRCFSSTGNPSMTFGSDGNDMEASKVSEDKSSEKLKDSASNGSTLQEDSEKSNENPKDSVNNVFTMQEGPEEAEREDIHSNGVLDDTNDTNDSINDDEDEEDDDDLYGYDDDDDEDYEDESEIEAHSGSEGSGSILAHLQAVPKRQRKFLLQKALKIPTKKRRVKIVKRKVLALKEFLMRQMRVVDVNRTCKVTKGGGVLNFTAFVVCGNCDGVAAFGKGKGQEVGEAVSKAQLRAIKNLHYFDIYKGHTIYHEQEAKYGKTKIRLWPAHSGTGMRACPVVKDILQLAGYKDVKTKVIGSRHPHNTVKAVFKALSMIESPEELSERVGSLVVESRLVQ
ncbi:hypothetical protein O6H91_10G071200 [Diphasiastrum complanatum]|uniref:Uncharacterized protein n=1 Tax=Diphasiastrum complanatum TaxID=34168 RepID=A0ACC2CI61_DIPCM|nr:hypothetical protein O6H91_10G071200 [Diphasiastrum complanatum]